MAVSAQKLIPVMFVEGVVIMALVVAFAMELISVPVLVAGVIVAGSFVAFFVVSLGKQVRTGDSSPLERDRAAENNHRE